ncbi:unnamed protein product [Arctia plantaginis]|uniref:Uncharacterized protein n=1 Tax=Arctia plantaginis TaxID=874455 RepID=A0A8S1BBS4_ARCPL|nr:unnamed protein product [Arctia plantaginis]CAB3260257.1 unnamed protein product [Arctia plantaginis]
MAPKKGGKEPAKKPGKEAVKVSGPPPKPKKIPPPPACFKPEDIARFKEVFKLHDEENIDKVPIDDIGIMLRRIGFNPKTAELQELFAKILEDDLVDQVEFHEFLFMIEAKMAMGDDFEVVIVNAMRDLGHDDEETGLVDFEKFREELMTWGEPLVDIEFMDWIKLCMKDKTYNIEDGTFRYIKFIENMNMRDRRFFPEPINYFKLDQKTLAAMAMQKAQEEKEAEEKKAAEKRAREEAKRQRMIAEGLIPPD